MAKTTAPKSAGKSRRGRAAEPVDGKARRTAPATGNGAGTVQRSTFPMPTGAFTVEQPADPGPKLDRHSFGKIPHVLEVHNLIELQKASFEWFRTEGLAEAFGSISPIKDFTGNLVLEFGEHSLGCLLYTSDAADE